ncbi:MAG: Ig-like domain-containing protein [Bryobacterales bacterium]|nr:Ig-like domain-containing protein [Bryobacterales bacterium]
MSLHSHIRRVLLCLTTLVPLALANNVFVMPPSDGTQRPVTPFAADPFAPASGAIAAAPDTFQALALPAGNKYYFVGRSGTNTVVVTDANYNVVNRLNLGVGAQAAALSPDGRFLVVVANTVQIISTANDAVVAQVNAGSLANDVAINRASTRAYVTSQGSGTVTVIDLGSFQTIATLSGLGPLNGITAGPNGFMYASATNILYEIDTRDNTLRNGSGIPLNAQPGKPVIFGDPFSGLRALLPNLNPAFGGSALISVDLANRTFTTVPTSGGIVFDRVVAISPARAFAVTTGGQLYQIDLPGTATLANLSGLNPNGVRSIVATPEYPTARFLFVASGNTLQRVDLGAGGVSGQYQLQNPAGPLVYAGPGATGNPTNLYLFNNGQFIPPGTQGLPLTVRVVDGTGKPLGNVPVQFSTAAAGATVTPTTVTDAEGYATSQIVAPATTGPFSVTVIAGSGTLVTGTFNLTAGTGTAGPTGAISIVSGNGQIVRENSPTAQLLTVLVRDTAGTPVPGAIVSWSAITNNGPNVTLSASETVTDQSGIATNTATGAFIGPNLFNSFVQATVTARTAAGSVDFYVTTIPTLFQGLPASPPAIQLLAPLNTDTITARAGTTLQDAVRVRVSAGSGPQTGAPIPNIAVNATTGLDSTLGPTASCASSSILTDSSGVGTCSLLVGSRLGTAPLTISAGGSTISTLNLVVTSGPPGKFVILQGDQQSGPAGQTLPLALVARVEDAFGNPLPDANVRWTVESGQATLTNTINRSSFDARVSTLVTLGNTPGEVRIRLTATDSGATATAVFSLQANISGTQLRRISGDGQSAVINSSFGEPLVAQVLDANNNGVPGVSVSFTAGGGVTLSATSATSDSQGRVQVTARAAGVPGQGTVTASFGGVSTSWTLTSRPVGPELNASGITNAASGLTDIAPGSLVVIRGRNIGGSAQGLVVPAVDLGPRPTQLAGVSVTFGSTPAPIFWVQNIAGDEAISVQVPFEVPAGGTVPVTITSNGSTATVDVTAKAAAPGVFETVDTQNRRYAVITRQDGSFVTPDNPIGRGEVARAYVTGLGRTANQAFTNTPGVGQRPNANIIVGVNDAGAELISAEYAPNLIGVYVVTFRVPANTPSGSRNFAVGADPGSGAEFGNGSVIWVQ